MLKARLLGIVVAGFMLVSAATAAAQVSREEFEALKSEVQGLRDAVKTQTDVLRQLLERAGAMRDGQDGPSKLTLSLDGAPFYGKPDAKVTVVEFSDYQCPFCARYALQTFPQLEREYIESGRVKYLFRDYPIEAAHPQAFKAHEAVHCAEEQGKRREMHQQVFANQRAMAPADLAAHARTLQLDAGRFESCLEKGAQAAKVRSAITAGEQAGVRGTPTFFLGVTEPNSRELKVVRRIVGAQPYSVFKAAIDELLTAK